MKIKLDDVKQQACHDEVARAIHKYGIHNVLDSMIRRFEDANGWPITYRAYRKILHKANDMALMVQELNLDGK